MPCVLDEEIQLMNMLKIAHLDVRSGIVFPYYRRAGFFRG